MQRVGETRRLLHDEMIVAVRVGPTSEIGSMKEWVKAFLHRMCSRMKHLRLPAEYGATRAKFCASSGGAVPVDRRLGARPYAPETLSRHVRPLVVHRMSYDHKQDKAG